MGTKTLMSLAEFERLPEDGNRHELSKGELLEMPAPKSEHTNVAMNVSEILLRYVTRDQGRVYSEAGYVLSHDPPTVRQPDVSFLSARRIRQTASDSYFEGAPELAVEIVSHANSADDLEEKVDQYLTAGAIEVWVVYPKRRRVHIYHADGRNTILTNTQEIAVDGLFPGMAIPVASFFG